MSTRCHTEPGMTQPHESSDPQSLAAVAQAIEDVAGGLSLARSSEDLERAVTDLLNIAQNARSVGETGDIEPTIKRHSRLDTCSKCDDHNHPCVCPGDAPAASRREVSS